MRPYGGDTRAQLRKLREAKEARPYRPPDPDDPVAVRWDRARRIHNFFRAEILEGQRDPNDPIPSVEEIHSWILADEAKENGEENQ